MSKVATSYEWGDKESRFNQLLFMDDFRLFVKNQYQMDSLVKTAYFFREVVRMAYGVSKCGVVLLRREKVIKLNYLVFPNGQMMRKIYEKKYKYLQSWPKYMRQTLVLV